MRIFVSLLCGCMCLLAVGAYADGAPDDLDRHIAGLERRYESMQDLQARFVQENRSGSFGPVQPGAGTVRFKKGGRMLWDYTSPEPQKIILDGKNLWLYLPDEKQVMKNDYGRLPSHIVADLFRGRVRIRDSYAVAPAPAEPGLIALELTPKEERPAMKRVMLVVDPATHFIMATEIEDMFGNRTVLRFSDIAVDAGLEDSLFEFTPPPGVDIFELPAANP